jgi:hypothetical protein
MPARHAAIGWPEGATAPAPEAGAFSEDVTTLGNVAAEVRTVGGAEVRRLVQADADAIA